jgi:hypothetical protein
MLAATPRNISIVSANIRKKRSMLGSSILA